MKNIVKLGIVLMFFQSFAQTNITCSTATSLNLIASQNQIITMDFTNVIPTAGITCVYGAGGAGQLHKKLWYSFTLPSDGNVIIANGDVNFELYDSCGGSLVNCFQNSGYSYSLVAGVTYYLEALTPFNVTGLHTFDIEYVPFVNNTCATAQNIGVLTDNFLNIVADNRASTPVYSFGCDGIVSSLYHDLYYSFTMPINGSVRITNANNLEHFFLYDSCGGNLLGCFKNSSYFYSLTLGHTYILKFSTRFNAVGIQNFNIQAFDTASNNTCATPTNLDVTTSTYLEVDVDTQHSTISNNNASCDNLNNSWLDLWYSFTMPVDGNIRITDVGNLDHFALFDACFGNEIKCFRNSSYFYSLNAGQTYWLRYANEEKYSGNFTFRIQAFETSSNINCANAETIFVNTSSIKNIDTNTATSVISSTNSSCENSNIWLDLWYTFTMPVNGNLNITNASNREYFTLYDTCSGTEIDCFNGNGIFTALTSGTTYVLKYTKQEKFSESDSFGIQAIEALPNTECVNPINLIVGKYNEFTEIKNFIGITASGVLPLPICADANTTIDAWFTIQVPNSGKVTIETTKIIGSTLNDTVLQAFSGTCGSLTEIDCDNGSGSNNFSRIELTGLTPSDVIYIRAFENGSDNINSYGIFAYDNACTSATNWDGIAWSNGTPDNTKIAVIDANYNTNSGNLDACMCKISANKNITVNANQYVKLVSNLYNYGSIDINHQASFVQVDDNAELLGDGSYNTVIKTTGLQDTNRFTYISSPVQNANLNVLNSWAKMNYIWDFDGTIQDWNHLTNTNIPMEIAKGYAVEGETTLDYSTPYVATTNFNGKFNNGIISQQVYYNVGGTDDDNTLVGNPYPSAIQISSLLDGAVNPSINAVYVWTHNSPLIGAGYANDDYIVCSSTNCISAYAGNNANNLNGYLASGQGFFVDTSDAVSNTITFNNSMRVTGNNTDFRTPDNQEQLWVNITSELGYFNQLGLSFTQNGTLDFDKKIDAKRLGTYYGLGFYSIGQNNERFAIEDKGILPEEITIPLGLYINDEQIQNLKISIDHFTNLEEVNIYLKDNLTNTIHNLKINDFTFSITETGVFNNRFELILQRNILNINEDSLSDENITVFQNETKEIVLKSSKTIKKVKIYNLLGKLLKEKNINNTNGKIKLSLSTNEVLVLQIQLKSGKIVNQKMIYQQ